MLPKPTSPFRPSFLWLGLALLFTCRLLATEPSTPAVVINPDEAPDQPALKLNKEGNADAGFKWKTQEFIKRGKAGPIGLLFVGDSITAGWEKVPELWQAEFGRWQPANFGIGGDRTEHVLWRIEQGMLDGHPPHVLVLLIGTNNLGRKKDVAAIFKGQQAIIDQIHRRLPKTKLLIMGVLPRGLDMTNGGVKRMREAITAMNAKLAQLDDGKLTRFLDIGAGFVDNAGNLNASLVPDGVHPNAEGYKVWANALRPVLADLMQDFNPNS